MTIVRTAVALVTEGHQVSQIQGKVRPLPSGDLVVNVRCLHPATDAPITIALKGLSAERSPCA